MQSSDNINILLTNTLVPTYKILNWKGHQIGYFISPSQTTPSRNEDSLFIIGKENFLVFGVSDGAGGHPMGKEASEIAGSEIIKSYGSSKNQEIKVLEVIEKINDKVIDLKVGAHCTLSMCTLLGNDLRSFSVGDSETIYWNRLGKEVYSNIPQSPIGHQIEAGILNQEQSLEHPERNIVHNMIGDQGIKIEVSSKMPLKKGHSILTGSDGLFDNISHDDLSEIVGRGKFKNSFQYLTKLCLDRAENQWRKDDDISFVFVRKISP